MGKKLYLVAIFAAMLIASSAPAQSMLPELQVHLRFARRAAENGHLSVLNAVAQVLAPKKITFAFDAQSMTDADAHAFEAALTGWESALDGEVTFERVAYPLEANLTIIGTERMSLGKHDVAGFTFWNRGLDSDYSPVLKAHILLARFAGKSALSPEARRHAAMHELGHVLGLDDSKRRGDIMGPLDPRHPASEPAWKELDTLRALRREVETLSQTSARLFARVPSGGR